LGIIWTGGNVAGITIPGINAVIPGVIVIALLWVLFAAIGYLAG
jgi:hypothetical protein